MSEWPRTLAVKVNTGGREEGRERTGEPEVQLLDLPAPTKKNTVQPNADRQHKQTKYGAGWGGSHLLKTQITEHCVKHKRILLAVEHPQC